MHMHHDLPCACTALRKTSRALTRLYDAALAPFGMTIQQFSVLRNIARADSIALSRLADVLVMDRTSLYRALTPLERSGWVVTHAGTGRTRIVQLTGEGHAALKAATPAWAAAQTRLIGEFGDQKWQDVSTGLHDLADLAQAVRQ